MEWKLVADDPQSAKPIKIGGLTISRRAALGTLVVLLYVAGAAFVVGYSNRDAPTTPAGWAWWPAQRSAMPQT